jgi:hypothetical protein
MDYNSTGSLSQGKHSSPVTISTQFRQQSPTMSTSIRAISREKLGRKIQLKDVPPPICLGIWFVVGVTKGDLPTRPSHSASCPECDRLPRRLLLSQCLYVIVHLSRNGTRRPVSKDSQPSLLRCPPGTIQVALL